MIKKIFLSLLILFIVFFAGVILRNIFLNNPNRIALLLEDKIQNADCKDCVSASDWLWRDGRSFELKVVYMNIFSPGTAKFLIKEGFSPKRESVYRLKASVNANKVLKRMYDANISLYSTIEEDSKLPLMYREVIITPDKEKTKEIKFYSHKNLAVREGNKIKIPDYTYDPLSVFLGFLSSDFEIGETITLYLLSKEEIYEFNITPLELKEGIYTLKGDVHRQDKSSLHGVDFTIWVLNDKKRIPLLIKVVSATGSVYARLVDIK